MKEKFKPEKRGSAMATFTLMILAGVGLSVWSMLTALGLVAPFR